MPHEEATAPLVSNREYGLRLLLASRASPTVLAAVFPQVVDSALDSSRLGTSTSAGEVLRLRAGEPWVRSRLHELAATYLPGQDEWQYRRLAELYGVLGYQDELAALLVLCRASSRADIRELAADFGCGAAGG